MQSWAPQSWVEWTAAGDALMTCRARADVGSIDIQVLTLSRAAGSINFPRMVQSGNEVYFAWTQPLDSRSADPELDSTIKMVIAPLAIGR